MFRRLTLVASLLALCPAGEAHAQYWTEPAQQLRALRAAFSAEPRLSVTPRGTEPYYDVVADNICGGAVEALARNWVRQSISNFLNRAVVINASVAFPDSSRRGFRAILLMAGNTADAQWLCQDSVVRAIPRTERVQITLELVVASELGQKTSTILTAVLGAGVGSLTGGWGIVGSLVLTGTKAYAAQTKKINQEVLAAGGKRYPASMVVMGQSVYSQKKRPQPVGYVSEAGFIGGGEERLRIRRRPRDLLLDYRPGAFDTAQIPASIDRVSVSKTWHEMLSAALADALDLSKANEASGFCSRFRQELQRSLQYDVVAVMLGLYAHFITNQWRFSAGRADRGCLEPSELRTLRERGYIAA